MSVVSRSRVRRLLPMILGMIAVPSLLASCDPCFGVRACSAGAYLAVDGQIVETFTGVGVDGIRIDVVRRTGVQVAVDSLSTVTSGGGHWRIQFAPAQAGAIDVDIVVRLPDGPSYRVNAVRIQSSTRGGDATVLGPWVTQPYFADVGEIYTRATGARVFAPSITFVRTGGIDISGARVSHDTISLASDSAGRLPLFSLTTGVVTSSSLGNVVGTLTVRRSPTDSSIIDSLVVRSTHVFRDPSRVIRIPLGLALPYAGQLYSRATGEPIRDIPVEFQRTGGVNVSTPQFTNTTNSDGKFSLSTPPLARGTLGGRIIFRVPPARVETVTVALAVFEGPRAPLYRYAAGAYFPYKGILRAGARGIENAKVSIQRVGGVATLTDVVTTQTDALGAFRFPLAPLSLGDVVVDFVITPPAPSGPITVRGVRLTAADRTVEEQLVGTYEAAIASSTSRSIPAMRLPP